MSKVAQTALENIYTTVCRTIAEKGLIAPGDQVIVGVSGGSDSVCLLRLLCRYAEEQPIDLFVAHVHHRLRGEEADIDADLVRQLAEDHGLPCRVFYRDVRDLSARQSLTTEEAARQARYQALVEWQQELAENGRRTRIAVAHNRNDQAETVLLRILRGTGGDGLAGMEYLRTDGLIRPLLNIPRPLIDTCVAEQGYPVREDATNRDSAYTRNRIRLELIPYLENRFNPTVVAALGRLAENLAEDRESFAEQVEQAKVAAVRFETPSNELCAQPGIPRIDRECYRAFAPALGKRLIVSLYKEIGLPQDLTAVHLNAVDRLIREGRTGGLIELPHGFRAEATTREVRLAFPGAANKAAGVPGRHEGTHHSALPIEGYGSFQNSITGERLVLTLLADSAPITADGCGGSGGERLRGETETTSPGYRRATLDADRLRPEAGLLLRRRQSGDTIMPLGMKGTKKIQNLLVDCKIPRVERDGWPLLCRGNEVVWAVGLRIDDRYQVGSLTRRIVLIEYWPPLC